MACNDQKIPPYLHWNNKKVFNNKDFYYFQKLYRIKPSGNPIIVHSPWINAISCKWSKLIKSAHIVLESDEKLGDDYDFVFVKELKKYKRSSVLNDPHDFKGLHVLTCVLKHKPENCNYAHSEILIRHRVYRLNEKYPFFDETYTAESWTDETAMLRKMKPKFFKELKSNFRVDMIKLISRKSSQNTILLNFRAMLYLVKWSNVA